MTKELLRIFTSILRNSLHYYNHSNSMMAENLVADTEGKDIPYNGDDFKDVSKRYHRKFEDIFRELEELEELKDGNTNEGQMSLL